MSIFQPSFVVSDDDTLIALKFVSELKYSSVDQDKVCERLQGDASLVVTTCHGKIYRISMKRQIDAFSKSFKISDDVEELRLAIYDKWLNYIR